MSNPKFRLGEEVTLLSAATGWHVPRGRYTVLRVMPRDQEGWSYRARGQADGAQRVLREEQLEAAGGAFRLP